MRRILRPRVLLLAAVIAVCPAALALASTPASKAGSPLATAPAPDTTIDSGPSGPTNSASPAFTFSSPQGPSPFACRLDASPFEPCTSPQVFSDLTEGAHTFYVRAGDGDGNGDRTPASSAFVVDTEAPATSVDSGPSAPTRDVRPAFGFSSPDDSATFACSIDTGTASFAPCSGTGTDQPAADLADGSYTFSVQATDEAGNSTTATRDFAVDTQAPALAVSSGPSGSTTDPRPAFGFSSADDSATFACSIDTGTARFAPCSGSGTDQPAADLAGGSYTFRVQATDEAGNSTTATRDFELKTAAPQRKKMAAYKADAPTPVPAWYMTARGAGDLKRQARNDACAFAKRQTNTTRLLLMDFGKSEKHDGHWGTQLRTGPHFTNQHILAALKAAAHIYRGHGPCYTRGSVRFTYGNTNNMPQWMSNRAARLAGRRQARMANRLQKYQRRQGLNFQGVAVAGDIEPQWNPPKITKDMVQGATAHKRGGLYFNYGAASECPPEGKRCVNGWDVKDLATVSYGGVRRALPEIYRRVHAKQWTRVRRYWNNNHERRFCFYGATSTPGFPVSMRESWARLRAKNRCVKRELVNIREQ